jgi:hypothetical protein
MSNRENKDSGFDFVTVAIAVFAICCTFGALMLVPAHATSEASDETPAPSVSVDDIAYLPAQYVNQAKDVEPMPAQF